MKYLFLCLCFISLTHNFYARSVSGNNNDLLYFRQQKKSKSKSELLSTLATYYLNNSTASGTEIELRMKNAYNLSKDDEKSYFLMVQIVYFYSKNTTKKAYQLSLKLSKQLNSLDHYAKADALTVLGNTSFTLKRLDEAANYYNKALYLCKKTNNQNCMQKVYVCLANYYLEKKNLEKARYYIEKARFLVINGVRLAREETYLTLALISLIQQETDLAKEYLKQANKSKNKLYLRPYIELQLGVISQMNKQEDEMLLHYERSLIYSHKFKNNNAASGVYQQLNAYYKGKKDYEKAYVFQLKLDSIVKISDLDRQAEIVKDLKFKEKIKLLNLEKVRKTEKLALEASNRKLLQLFLCIVIILLLFVIYMYQLQRKKNFILVKKNLESLKKFDEPEEIPKEIDPDRSDFIPSIELITRIEKLLTEKELFKDPEITIQKLALRLNVSSITLSKNINSHYKIPFRNLINNQRIELAKYMLADNRYDKFSIEGIASSVGYTNKTTFYNNFKQITGVTPLFYREASKKIVIGENHSNN